MRRGATLRVIRVSHQSSDDPIVAVVAMPPNYLRPCLLLMLMEGTAHGYELLDRVTELGLARVDPGRLYRCLRAMDEDGLIQSQWEPSTLGPARRTYVLTNAGRESLASEVGSLAEAMRAMEAFRRRYRLAVDRESR